MKDGDNALARLIALFPGTDISVLSMAIEKCETTDQAAEFVRRMIKSSSDAEEEEEESPGYRKPRPQGSARRREKKLSEDSQQQADEDEEFARRLIGESHSPDAVSNGSHGHLNRRGNEMDLRPEDDKAYKKSSPPSGLKSHHATLSLSPSPTQTDSEDEDDGKNSMTFSDSEGGDRSLQHQVQELYAYISTYQPETIEVFPELKCFIPDYIPAIGDIDPMIKIPAPSVSKPTAKGPATTPMDTTHLGLKILDEPATKQSDPAVLDLQLRAASKETHSVMNQQVRSIQLTFSQAPGADGGQKALAQWVQNVQDLHTHKPPDRVEYSKRMPDIEKLMEEWPQEIDDALTNNVIHLPSGDVDLPLRDYVKIICSILDIPVGQVAPVSSNPGRNRGAFKTEAKSHAIIESLHVLFTLYTEFKNSQHFGRIK